ncbi:MAG: hypothetical protein HYV27_02850 [Candidatus Hydrogenedentes bacterium]|nr:hypothetical protein [Candidatus Hydrogenedentota bacterium]
MRILVNLAVGAITVALVAGLFAGCARTQAQLTRLTRPVTSIITPLLTPIFGRAEGDFSNLSRVKAFEALHAKLAAEYPFTAHKAIDWQALHDAYAPRVAAAEAARDEDAYYLALRSYIYAIPDGMMGMTYRNEVLDPRVEASFGLRVMTVEDGRTIAYAIEDGGPAAQAGIAWGAEILTWNNKPIAEALAQVETFWPDAPAATTALRQLRAQHYLRRGPENAQALVGYKNPGAPEAALAPLKAAKDGYEGLKDASQFYASIDEESDPMRTERLASGAAYIRIFFMAPSFSTPFPAQAFRNALEEAVKDQASGIILDLRGNGTGVDAFIPEFAGHFVEKEMPFNTTVVLNENRVFEANHDLDLLITPQEPRVSCPVVVLVSASTSGSCEGLAWALQQQPNVTVMGFHGTGGVYGLAGGEIQMPGGFTVLYPMGRYECEGKILLTADGAGNGGVQPGIRLPITEEVLRAMRLEGRDVLLEAAEARIQEAEGK